MKAIATVALIGLAAASEDNELFKFDNIRVASHHNETRADHIRPHPIHHNDAHNVTVKPRTLKPIRPILFNRTQTYKPMRTFDDEELFLNSEIAENELSVKQPAQGNSELPKKKKGGPGKWVDRNKEWIAPVGGKVLDKILSALDDDEFFLNEVADDEFMSKKAWQIYLAARDQQAGGVKPAAPVAQANPEEGAHVAGPSQETAPVMPMPAPKKKGGPGKWIGRNKEWIAPIGTKILDKIFEKLDDEELFVNEVADDEFMSKKAWQIYNNAREQQAGGVKPAAPVAQVAQANPEEGAHVAGPSQEAAPVMPKKKKGGLGKIGKTIASVGLKVLPALLLDDEEENELFNLGGLIKDGLNVYGDIKNKDYGNLVNHGVQTIKDIKKHDDDELFEVRRGQNKAFLSAL